MGELDPRQMRVVQIARTACEREIRMVTTLLDLSRLRAGSPLRLTNGVALESVVQHAVAADLAAGADWLVHRHADGPSWSLRLGDDRSKIQALYISVDPDRDTPPVLKAGDDCPDTTLAAKGITNQPTYVIGDQPKFTMVVTNIGLTACQRDVGAAVLAAYVYTLDNKRLWSNLDCAPSNETLVKTFNPGEQVTTEVTWTGMGSAPQCPLPRQPIGPGTYNLVVQLGNLRSATVPFVLAEPSAQDPAAPAPPPAPDAPAPPPEGPAPAPAG